MYKRVIRREKTVWVFFFLTLIDENVQKPSPQRKGGCAGSWLSGTGGGGAAWKEVWPPFLSARTPLEPSKLGPSHSNQTQNTVPALTLSVLIRRWLLTHKVLNHGSLAGKGRQNLTHAQKALFWESSTSGLQIRLKAQDELSIISYC